MRPRVWPRLGDGPGWGSVGRPCACRDRVTTACVTAWSAKAGGTLCCLAARSRSISLDLAAARRASDRTPFRSRRRATPSPSRSLSTLSLSLHLLALPPALSPSSLSLSVAACFDRDPPPLLWCRQLRLSPPLWLPSGAGRRRRVVLSHHLMPTHSSLSLRVLVTKPPRLLVA